MPKPVRNVVPMRRRPGEETAMSASPKRQRAANPGQPAKSSKGDKVATLPKRRRSSTNLKPSQGVRVATVVANMPVRQVHGHVEVDGPLVTVRYKQQRSSKHFRATFDMRQLLAFQPGDNGFIAVRGTQQIANVAVEEVTRHEDFMVLTTVDGHEIYTAIMDGLDVSIVEGAD
jgi:hypothetical protein